MSLFPKHIEKKFTKHLKDVLQAAEELARDLSQDEIRVEHLVFSIISQEGSIGSNMLGGEKPDLKELQARIERLPKGAEEPVCRTISKASSSP
jgi:ATP-dependent Clp protease ATP-binding subunit ClpA